MMKLKLLAWLVIIAMMVLASCESAPAQPASSLSQMWDAQDRATIAALTLQRAAGIATSQADSTREYLLLASQQTRLAQDARATQTTFAQNSAGTVTAQSGQATATVIAAQFMATAYAQNVSGTATTQSGQATATTQAAQSTATAQSIIVNATQQSASATATSNAANAQATRTSNDATATVAAAQALTAQEKAEWDKRLESGRALAVFVFGTLLLIGIAVVIGFAALRFIDAGVLRARVFRDKTGTVFVIGERDQAGRQAVLIPGRSPGAALNITPPDAQPLQIEANAVDADTTKRDQAVSLMIAATSGKGNRGEDVVRELTEGEQVRFVDEPPAQLVNGDTAQLLDGAWTLRGLSDGSETK